MFLLVIVHPEGSDRKHERANEVTQATTARPRAIAVGEDVAALILPGTGRAAPRCPAALNETISA
ncbi:hypothetical protein DFR71_5799 [Nocardia alba]|uniref:Uncharacterized protein n=1 Tax=Nocardia alba TaxID=225051 RepID=A0A4R1FLQ5_9NOCA|nr:hypothetical protein DFR71_5799 [Nocardia alba]